MAKSVRISKEQTDMEKMQLMNLSNNQPPPDPNQMLGSLLEELLIPECIIVQRNFPVGPGRPIKVAEVKNDEICIGRELMLDPIPIGTVLRSLEKDKWTKEQKKVLPDSIRDRHVRNILIEYRHDKPLENNDLREMMAKLFFYCEVLNYQDKEVRCYVITNHPFPDNFFHELKYYQVKNGIYRTKEQLLNRILLISVDHLPNKSWNAPFKLFSSNEEDRKKAADFLLKRALNFPEVNVVTGKGQC